MILFINYYKDNSEQRQTELDYCLYKNLSHNLISKVVIFTETEAILPLNSKIITVLCNERPTYSDFFEKANEFNGIKILANSDIYFNKTLELAANIKNNEIYALCRWNKIAAGLEFYNKTSSQDVWIWKDKIFVDADFSLGIPGCDNVIAYKLNKGKYIVSNPSLSIQCIHLHKERKRNYESEIGINKFQLPEPYLFLSPSYII